MDLASIVEALKDSRAYPEPAEKVEVIQTQASVLFLAGDYVYKVKKPVDFGYQDYSTLEKRRYYCQQEVVLNRRLSPDIYLGVADVVRLGQRIAIDAPGEPLEPAVKMRRLAPERMMDVLLRQGKVTPEMVERVAEKVAQFHAQAATSPEIAAMGSLETARFNVEENFQQTEAVIDVCLTRESCERIGAYSLSFLEENADLLRHRSQEGRVRDCHGDLHTAHVNFADGIYIYDCIEFNDRFRYADVAAEVAFLAMDLDYQRYGGLSRAFVDAYVRFSGDAELIRLLDFYKCYYAYVRGKVLSFKLRDPLVQEEDKRQTLEVARSYFNLALSYASPLLLLMCGLVGTGKSHLAEHLARELDALIVSSDIVRKELAGIEANEHRFESFETGIYTPEFSRRTYEELFARARPLLRQGRTVILDASFFRENERQQALEVAGETGARLLLVECTAPDEVIKDRLTRRMEAGTVSDGRWEIYLVQRERFEPFAAFPAQSRATIDTSRDIEQIVGEIVAKIRSIDRPASQEPANKGKGNERTR